MATKTRAKYRSVHQYYRTRTCPDSTGVWSEWNYQSDTYVSPYLEDTVTAVFSRTKPATLSATPLTAVHRGYRWYMSETDYTVVSHPTGYLYEKNWHGMNNWVLSSSGQGAGSYSSITTSAPSGGDSFVMGRAAARFTGSRANLGESLGELRETGGTIVKRAKQAHAIFRKLRSPKAIDEMARTGKISRSMADRLKSIQPWKSSKRAAQAYLEISFMWVPLLQDIYNILDYRNAKLSAGDTVKATSSYGDVASGGYWRGGYYGKVSNERLANLNAYGLANPALTAWQLTSLSFIADWFLNVSAVLGQLTAFVGFTAVSGWKIEVSTLRQSYSVAGLDTMQVTAKRTVVLPFTGIYFSAALTSDGRAFAGQLITLASLFRVGRFN